MELTADGISIETSETDRVEWVSDAEVVGTGESLSFDADLGGYLRAHLSNEAGSAASTQPFGLDPAA
jgi:hypothetical protein